MRTALRIGWIIMGLWLGACGIRPVSPTPTSTPGPRPTMPRPTPEPPTPPPLSIKGEHPASSIPTPQPLPDGFRTDGEWMVVFRPALEHQTWLDGWTWLTNGQRWIGPWPPDLAPPVSWRFTDLMSKKLPIFCHFRWNEEESKRPICAEFYDHLEIDVYFCSLRGVSIRGGGVPGATSAVLTKLVPCGGTGEVCLETGDCPSEGCLRSPPIRLPLPEPLKAAFPYARVRGCADLQANPPHAIGAILRGDPADPSAFPGGLYWVDLRSGRVVLAPTNAPTWPDQRALARALSERGILPLALSPLLEGSRWGPTIEAEWGCSPSGQFMLVAQGMWHSASRVRLPADTWPIESSRDAQTAILILWVIRLKDGVGYPIAVRAAGFNDRYLTGWVEPVMQTLIPSEYRSPDYPLPFPRR